MKTQKIKDHGSYGFLKELYSTQWNIMWCSKAEFKSPALQCQTCTILYHLTCATLWNIMGLGFGTCAKMPLYYMVRYASSSVSFVCKQCTEKSAESHWTETVHLFKDCYPNLNDIENPLDKNATDVRVETESILPTSRENSKANRQIFEDASSTQDQDILQDQDIIQEQIQEWMEPANEIEICKLNMESCCKHVFGDNNRNYPHGALCKKNILKP